MPKYTNIYNHKIKDNSNKTESQLAKFKRQKCINLTEKLLKNLFKMFRDEAVGLATIEKRFFTLKKKIDGLGSVPLDNTYNKAVKKYIDTLEKLFPSIEDINAIRQEQLTQLNRLQKIKNDKIYKKAKHQECYK